MMVESPSILGFADPLAKATRNNNGFVFKIFVIPAKAGNHPSASTCGAMGSRFRGNDEINMMRSLLGGALGCKPVARERITGLDAAAVR
jgi:hypothetical protein